MIYYIMNIGISFEIFVMLVTDATSYGGGMSRIY